MNGKYFIIVFCYCSKMGYVDGKTDADLLIEELDVNEDYERIVVLQVCIILWCIYTVHTCVCSPVVLQWVS